MCIVVSQSALCVLQLLWWYTAGYWLKVAKVIAHKQWIHPTATCPWFEFGFAWRYCCWIVMILWFGSVFGRNIAWILFNCFAHGSSSFRFHMDNMEVIIDNITGTFSSKSHSNSRLFKTVDNNRKNANKYAPIKLIQFPKLPNGISRRVFNIKQTSWDAVRQQRNF